MSTYCQRIQNTIDWLAWTEQEPVPASEPQSTLKVGSIMIRDIMGLEDRFNFGKHGPQRSRAEGLTLEAVIDSDPGWIEWSIKNNVVPYTREAVEYMEERDIEMTGA